MAATAQEDGVRSPAPGPRGCEHYDRACLLKAPCCDKLYTCRLCHDTHEDHQLDRFKVKEVQCINCEKLQHAQQTCEDCSTLFGEYYCSICHLFDKDKKHVLKMFPGRIVQYAWRTFIPPVSLLMSCHAGISYIERVMKKC
ncbi:ring finger and CHY zinc finger domain containing 1, isoform CRA_d [Rattus norvegicus]|uniref:Ring finger and CHY zinc finger domain containing 1, isoform CRA_d n=1 Tax=Rattus norvegicus TaxID=10116 RepID=A6KKB8_RAT|nr:ring finger and CHY zinc finger domain containing 1, isoform CRA_d [Rattus norvegicus]